MSETKIVVDKFKEKLDVASKKLKSIRQAKYRFYGKNRSIVILKSEKRSDATERM